MLAHRVPRCDGPREDLPQLGFTSRRQQRRHHTPYSAAGTRSATAPRSRCRSPRASPRAPLLITGSLYATDAHGTLRAATDEELLDAARAILSSRVRRGRPLTSPRHTPDYLRLQLAHLEYELFAVLFLDNRHRVIEFAPLFRGTVDGAIVHPREVEKEALARNAAAVILAHNHPSGIAEPSQADELITVRVRNALALGDIRVLDHLVVTGTAIVSFAERGLL